VLLAYPGPQGRTLLYAMKNSCFFDFARQVKTETEGHDLLARGRVQFGQDAIANHKVFIGMTAGECIRSCGGPERVNTTVTEKGDDVNAAKSASW